MTIPARVRSVVGWTACAVLAASVIAVPAASADPPAPGTVLRTIDDPPADRTGTKCATGLSKAGTGLGIAFDGTQLLLSCLTDDTITAVSPVDGSLIAVHKLPHKPPTEIGALAWDGPDQVLLGCTNLTNVSAIDLNTNSFWVLFSTKLSDTDTNGGCRDGLAYDAFNGTVWTSGQAASLIRHWKLDGTNLGGDFPLPTSPGPANSNGLAVTGSDGTGPGGGSGSLFIANSLDHDIYSAGKGLATATLFTTDTSSTKTQEDMECDGSTFDDGLGNPVTAIWAMHAKDNKLVAFATGDTCPGDPALEPGPSISSVIGSPGVIRFSGSGQNLSTAATINGSGFLDPLRPVTKMFFGRSQAYDPATMEFTTVSDPSIDITHLPDGDPGPLTGRIVVYSDLDHHVALSPADFKIKPRIKNYADTNGDPHSGPIGEFVTLTGWAFTGATKVTFDGFVATFTVVDYHTITMTIPDCGGCPFGQFEVFTAGGHQQTRHVYTIEYP